MITVKKGRRQITVSGHAGYAEKGHDIVCAAVSILIYNLQNSIESLTDDTVGFSFCPDVTIIEYGTLSAQGRLLVNSFINGLELLSANYPRNIFLLDRKPENYLQKAQNYCQQKNKPR